MESRKLNRLRHFQLEQLASNRANWGFLCTGQWTSTVTNMTDHFLEFRAKV